MKRGRMWAVFLGVSTSGCFFDAIGFPEAGSTTASSQTATGSPTTGGGAECGDGVKDDGEECDAGPMGDGTCTPSCALNVCGDGHVGAGESCDDDTPGCENCTLACGDGEVGPDEECDDGNQVDTDACPTTCKKAACGDGFVQAGAEECDDGNELDDDSCVAGCKIAVCGDGFVWEGKEECDDGNGTNTDECSNACEDAVCGDGITGPGEVCDDGNVSGDDSCYFDCSCHTMMMYVDADNDGFGDPDMPVVGCVGVPGVAPNDGDCNDKAANAHPDHAEVCDGIDNDCDDLLDEYDAVGNNIGCGGCAFTIREQRLYYFCDLQADWQSAEGFCVAHGLHLAKDDGGGEHDWLVEQMGDSGLWWIGANDKRSEGQFKWVSDGSDVPQPGLWGNGEPNNQEYIAFEGADCAGLLDADGENGYSGQAGRWNDYKCDRDEKFICEGPVP